MRDVSISTRKLSILVLALPFAARRSEPAAAPDRPRLPSQAPRRLPGAGGRTGSGPRFAVIRRRAGCGAMSAPLLGDARGPALSLHASAPRPRTAPISPAITRSPPGAAATLAARPRSSTSRNGRVAFPARAAPDQHRLGPRPGSATGRSAIAACASTRDSRLLDRDRRAAATSRRKRHLFTNGPAPPCARSSRRHAPGAALPGMSRAGPNSPPSATGRPSSRSICSRRWSARCRPPCCPGATMAGT